MIAGYSSRYKVVAGRSLAKKRSGQRLALGKWFWKLSGAIIVVATAIGMAGGFWFSWSISRGFDDLARQRGIKHALLQANQDLEKQKGKLFDKDRVEAIASARLFLAPEEKDLGGGVIVRVPQP
ncbi:MAG: hypothetical protein HY885_11125 [Deltaproteobacteria bacterium]|nr:hypothetical protein [Deltaproteobacteria bacterium]